MLTRLTSAIRAFFGPRKPFAYMARDRVVDAMLLTLALVYAAAVYWAHFTFLRSLFF